MSKELVPVRRPSKAQKAVEERIRVIRGRQVVLDSDLAEFYEVETRILVRQMQRNKERFPEDFCFQLTSEEFESLRSQNGISKTDVDGRGGRRYRPYVFTEPGAIAIAGVLRSGRAAEVSVEVFRAFVSMRQRLHELDDVPAVVAEIQNRLDELEENDADLAAQMETLTEALKALKPVLKALGSAEKQIPQIEKAK
jgi:DNA-binding transcriptional MerR regulator